MVGDNSHWKNCIRVPPLVTASTYKVGCKKDKTFVMKTSSATGGSSWADMTALIALVSVSAVVGAAVGAKERKSGAAMMRASRTRSSRLVALFLLGLTATSAGEARSELGSRSDGAHAVGTVRTDPAGGGSPSSLRHGTRHGTSSAGSTGSGGRGAVPGVDASNGVVRTISGEGTIPVDPRRGSASTRRSSASSAGSTGSSSGGGGAPDALRRRKLLAAAVEGTVSTAAGSSSGFANGVATAAKFNHPGGIAFDPTGSYVLIADKYNNRIRKLVLATGAVTTAAGSSPVYVNGVNTAQFTNPSGITFDPTGSYVLFVYRSNHRIR
jgi:hypothetical protein